jgi:hypothetical protein
MSQENKAYTATIPHSQPLPDRIRTYDISYQLIRPEEFASLGIDAQDVPVGTFVAGDHPPFLASRFGGNAYGFGIVEHQDKLDASELEFLEHLDFTDQAILKRHYRRINSIYRKLGLLMRFSRQGRRYFLIPINWVSHSLEDIRDKVDEIERILIKQIYQLKKEKLNVALLTAANDLVVHQISGRMPTQRFVVIDSIDRLREARGPFDLIVIPNDIDDLLLSLGIENLAGSRLTQQSFTTYGTYVAGKIYDLLGAAGELFVIANKPFPRANREVWVEFLNPDDLRSFLLFTHVFRSRKRYRVKSGGLLRVNLTDFYNYLSGIFVYREDLKKILNEQDPAQLTTEEIDRLPHLDLRISHPRRADLERRWERVLSPFFARIVCQSKLSSSLKENWQENYIIEDELPDNLQIYVGRKRRPPVFLEQLEQEERASGMAGCFLALVAGYKNTFTYLLAVLQVLADIRDKRFDRLSELDLNRLHNPFAAPKNRYRAFRHIKRLMQQTGRLRRLEALLNPGCIEGTSTRVLENLEKLGLLGLPPALLREIYLVVVGHTIMGRITFGKVPERTLKTITDRGKNQSLEEMADLLRIIRLMSMAEIAASLGENLSREQGRELFTLYDEAIRIAADPQLDWEMLHDQQIAALGGAQNLAVRQMLKMFNLFEYLYSWTALTDRGPFQKEALADYRPEKLDQIDQVLGLIGITNDFKERFYEREVFSRPYFFRKLLNCQFHGTGRLFPLLGTRAGFILLWISINASPANVINFNPLLSFGPEEGDDRPVRLRSALESLQADQLHFSYLSNIKKALSRGRPAFIFDSGIQLRYNPANQATEVVFVDVAKNLEKMELILHPISECAISEIPVNELKEADRLFGELRGYHEHLQEYAGQTGMNGDVLTEHKAAISRHCDRLEELFTEKLFQPQRLFDNLEILHEHCPNIGRSILEEFWELHRIEPDHTTYAGDTVPGYVLRCVKKFQALVNKDRMALQDSDTFYQLAQQQFGPMTGETIGASNLQIDILEGIVDRISTKNSSILEALGAGLVLQEIDKLPLDPQEYRSLSLKEAHAGAGAETLRREAVLRGLGMDEETSHMAEFFVRVHGLLCRVIRGEEPLPALEAVTASGDELVFEAFFLHSVITAAAHREGVMVEDLLDRFLDIRQVALRVLRGEMSWRSQAEQWVLEKGQGLLTETYETKAEKWPLALFSDWGVPANEEGLRHKGEDAVAVERLFRLVGLTDINLVDVQMKILGMPVSFVYHKKALKSTGLQKFSRELDEAMHIYQIVVGLDEGIRRYLIGRLSPGRGLVRIHGLEYTARHLDAESWLKLVLLGLRGIDSFDGGADRAQVLDFGHLNLVIGRRYLAIGEELANLSMERLHEDGRLLSRLRRARVGIVLECNEEYQVCRLGFRDRLQMEEVLQRVRGQDDMLRLKRLYHRELKRLKNSRYHTEDYQKLLSEVFHARLQELIELTLKHGQRRMRQQRGFSGLERVFTGMMSLAEENDFTHEQVELLKDMYEFNRDRLRNQRLQEIYENIHACGTSTDLLRLWEKIRAELLENRRHLGKEFEDLVTRRFDEQLAWLGEQ